jgi:hypothetical protein
MTDLTKLEKWIHGQQYVEARYATNLDGPEHHAAGVAIGYTDRPTLSIRTADGRIVSWVADLCVAVESPTSEKAALPTGGQERSPAVEHLESEVAFWRGKAESLREKIKQIAKLDPLMPPEPPVGTVYFSQHGVKIWDRRHDGWHCWRDGEECRNCPCEWDEAWDFGIESDGNTRRLP